MTIKKKDSIKKKSTSPVKKTVKKVESKPKKTALKVVKSSVKKEAKKVVSKKSVKVVKSEGTKPKKIIKNPVKKQVVKKEPIKKEPVKKVVSVKAKADAESVDATIFEKSLDLVKGLNSQIKKVSIAKDELRNDIANLEKKVASQEGKVKKYSDVSHQKNALAMLKQEIMEEFAPLIEKLNLKSFKNEVNKEIENFIEVESKKLKSELDMKSNRSKRDLAKKLSDLEAKLIEVVSNNEKLKKEIKKQDRMKIGDEISLSIDKISKSFQSKLSDKQKVIDDLKKSQDSLQKSISRLEIKVGKMKSGAKNVSVQDGLDLSSIESKIKKLENENKSIKKLVDKYEDELYNRKKSESLMVEEKVKEILSETNRKVEQISSDKDSIEVYVEKKINETVDFVNSLETKFKVLEKQDVKKFEKSLFDKLKGMFEDARLELNLKVDSLLSGIRRSRDIDRKDFDKFKKETTKFVEDYIENLNKEIKNVKDVLESNMHSNFEKKLTTLRKALNKEEIDLKGELKLLKVEGEAQKKYFIDRYNLIVGEIKEMQEKELKDTKDMLDKKAKELIEEVNVSLAKQIAKNNEFTTKISLENKEELRKLNEAVESKFFTAKTQYDKIFEDKISEVNSRLEKEEENFLNKLNFIEGEKDNFVSEMTAFKDEIGTLTKEYITKLDDELQTIKATEINFTNEREAFFSELTTISQAKKLELQEYAKDVENKIYSILDEEKARFDSSENSFRETFKEKVTTLREVLDKRIDNLEKRFVEKNLKYITDKINSEMKMFELYDKKLDAKKEEIDLIAADFNRGMEEFFVNIEAEHDRINSKIEERQTNMEQRLNSRFLDYDGLFANFKSVVVEEVEDLIKEVNTIVEEKMKLADQKIRDLTLRIKEFDKVDRRIRKEEMAVEEMKVSVEHQIRDIRNEVNDNRVKLSLIHDTSGHTMADHVKYMAEYEMQLVSLVKSLKVRGMTDNNIRQALINKGHPAFYVSMILDNFDVIYDEQGY